MNAVIIGGGAAGLMAGCLLSRGGANVTILEKQPRVGRKLLSTGNGRCNLTNINASPQDYRGDARYVRAALNRLSPEGAIDLFAQMGVLCEADAEGRVYPAGNLAAGVLDGLRLYALEHGCEICTERGARAISRANDVWRIDCEDGTRLRANFVLIACGGLAAPKLGACADGYRLLESVGHRLTPRHPAIAALKTDANAVRALKGIRMRGEIALCGREGVIRAERGEILFGDGAISGIAAMQLARDVNLRAGEKLTARMNFCPNAAPDIADMMKKRAELLPRRAMDDFLSGMLPKRLGQTLVKAAGIDLAAEAGTLGQRELARLGQTLTAWTLPVTGTQGFDAAQVTSGGAALSMFDPETLESKVCKNLYAAGEVLDVDGDCGGFNLHWAWASACLVADAILKRCGK